VSCEFYKELIFKKLDNYINDDEEKLLLEHLKMCGECQSDYTKLHEIEDILQQQDMIDVPESFSGAVIDRIKHPVKKRFFFKPVFTVAAACIILVIAFYSHAFETLLSGGNIVQKQNTQTQYSLSGDADKEKQNVSDAQLSPYKQVLPDDIQYKDSDDSQLNHQQIQQPSNQVLKNQVQPDTKTPTEQQANQNIENSDLPNQDIQQRYSQDNQKEQQPDEDNAYGSGADEEQQQTQDQTQEAQRSMTGATIMALPESQDQNAYNMTAAITAPKEIIQEILKKYSIIQSSDFEYLISKSEFEKLLENLKKESIQVEINEINIRVGHSVINYNRKIDKNKPKF
jgi:hypothetical protein